MSNGDILNTVRPVWLQIPMDHRRLDDSCTPAYSQIWICESIAKSSLTILNNKINTQLCCRTSHEFHCRPHHLRVIASRETNEMNRIKVQSSRNWFPNSNSIYFAASASAPVSWRLSGWSWNHCFIVLMIQRGGKCSLNTKWMFWPTEMLRSSARNIFDEKLRTLRHWPQTYKWNRMDPYQWCIVWSILRPFLAIRNPNSADSYWQRAVWASSLDGYAAHCVRTPAVWCHYSTVQWRAWIAILHNLRGELAVDEWKWICESSRGSFRKIYSLCQTRTVWPIVTHLIIARRFIFVEYAIEYAIFEAQRLIRMSNNDKYE